MTALLLFQLRRVGRNRQYLLFTVLLPALFTVFFTQVFGAQTDTETQYQFYAAQYMVSMMAYGALGAALGATIRLAFDRASGWLRQLRVTPVATRDLIAVEVAVGTLLTLPSLLVVALVGRFVTGVELGLGAWLALVALMWAGSTTFVALGLLIGLALEEKAAGAAIGIVGVVLAALGGLWVPVQIFPEALQAVAVALPSYWYAELGRAVVSGEVPDVATLASLAAFTIGFSVLAAAVSRRRPLYAVAG